jgi:ethanolamine utilization cobalamin adenosyltransferase
LVKQGGINLYQVEDFKQINVPDKIAVTKHAKERLEERGIKLDDVIHCIDAGEIIKQYEDDKPLPSCLLLGKDSDDKYMHIVVSRDEEYLYLITAYYPDNTQWEADLKTRKER